MKDEFTIYVRHPDGRVWNEKVWAATAEKALKIARQKYPEFEVQLTRFAD